MVEYYNLARFLVIIFSTILGMCQILTIIFVETCPVPTNSRNMFFSYEGLILSTLIVYELLVDVLIQFRTI